MGWTEAGPATTATASAWFFGWIFALHGAGSLFTRGLFDRERASGYVLHKCASVSLGLFLLSVWTFACGALGRLERSAVLVFFAAGLVFCALDKRRWLSTEIRHYSRLLCETTVLERVLGAAFLALAGVSFVAAQSPETGNDSLAYHFYFARQHAEAGRLAADALHPRAYWPSMMGMLYAAGMAVQGAALAKLFSWIAAPLVVLGVVAAAGFYFGRRAARWAGALAVTLPVVWMQSAYAYSDNAIALYAFLAFVILWRASESDWRGSFVPAAGFCLAALCSLKLYAITHALAILALFAFVGRGRAVQRGAALVEAGLFALAFAGPWYLRSWLATGNPVYPFLADWFGGNGFAQTMVGRSPLPKDFFSFAAVPWNVSMRPEWFGGEPFGALFLAALPLGFVPKRPSALAAAAGIAALAFAVLWFFSIQLARFLVPALPLGALFLSERCATAGEARLLRRPALAALALLAAVQAALGAYYPSRLAAAALGAEPADRFLATRERSYEFMKSLDG
jgi:hypothetical protein